VWSQKQEKDLALKCAVEQQPLLQPTILGFAEANASVVLPLI
jgi:hypothetical protein